jgi:squalene-associated FAD-dependent desaturase
MRRIVVVGGGLAGINAALRCADGGADVVLLEARPRLGGLTFSFRRGNLDVDNGQHVFLRCCTSYLDFLRRLGVADRVFLQQRLDIPVRSTSDTRTARLTRAGLPAPLHLGSALLRFSPLTPRQRVRAARAALALRGVDRDDPATDALVFGDWLRAHGQDESSIAALWDLVGVATLNARAEHVSLALAAMVFQVGLLTDARAADIGWSLVPLQRLHGDPAQTRLEEAGVEVHTATRANGLRRDGGRWLVSAATREFGADHVIVATPPAATEALLPPGVVRSAPGWAERLGLSPIVNVHIVLGARVLDEPFLACVGSPVQWIFDRTGPSGLGAGQYLALSLSAADEFIDMPTAALRERLMPQLAKVLPGLPRAEVLDFFVTRERGATFRPAPGTRSLRASAVTAAPGLVLAGAWTDTGWPATMEGAVRSGDTAARAVLGLLCDREEAIA